MNFPIHKTVHNTPAFRLERLWIECISSQNPNWLRDGGIGVGSRGDWQPAVHIRNDPGCQALLLAGDLVARSVEFRELLSGCYGYGL